MNKFDGNIVMKAWSFSIKKNNEPNIRIIISIIMKSILISSLNTDLMRKLVFLKTN